MNIKTLFTVIAMTTLSLNANAQGASDNASAASTHSIKAIGHGLASGAQVASGLAAAPFLVVGSLGVASLAVGEALMDTASGKSKEIPQQPKTSEITEITITTAPTPAEAMQQAPQ